MQYFLTVINHVNFNFVHKISLQDKVVCEPCTKFCNKKILIWETRYCLCLCDSITIEKNLLHYTKARKDVLYMRFI